MPVMGIKVNRQWKYAEAMLAVSLMLKSFLKKYLEYTFGYPRPRVMRNSFI